MSVTRTPQHRRPGRGTRDSSGPEAVTEASRSAERDDSRATITALADVVASLTRQMGNLQAIVMDMQSPPDASAGTVRPPPEDGQRTSETDYAAKITKDRVVQDVSWFENGDDSTPKPENVPFAPNPWLQQIATASQIETFDGDTRKWPTFIANFRALVHETVRSDAQRMAILGQLLSPKLRNGFSGLLANPAMYQEVLRRLHRLYGDPKALAKVNLNDLMTLAPLRSEHTGDLETFFCKVSGPVSTMKLCGLVHDLNSIALLEHTRSKLTQRLHERWLS
uniref:Retrotransposon gag domain-containing protein n=1 Tax=Trichuris muris TaxID=70415 RepID=A0A5S6Q4I5_TRIMR